MKKLLILLIPLLSFSQIDIVGGTDADISDYPWQVALIEQSGGWIWAFCGGSIIDSNWILTAAHCMEDVNINNLYVRAGSDNSYAQGGVSYSVEEVIVHPNYNSNTMNNDIALIKLNNSISFNSNKQPINLMCDFQADLGAQNPGVEATITGWGETETNNYNGTLQVAEVPITNTSNYGWGQIDADMIMAGYFSGGTDTCQGDSGGPMVVRDVDDTDWLLAGITSWGYGCAEVGYPGVYTRVSYFEDWICTNTDGDVCASEVEICNLTVLGCTWSDACNYNLDANQDDGSCVFAQLGYDCNGNCLEDDDNDGICNTDEILGCTDSGACNYNLQATDNDGSCDYPNPGFDCNGNCIEVLVEIQECDCNTNETSIVYTTYNPQLCTWFELCTCECTNDVNNNGICDEDEVPTSNTQLIDLTSGWNIWSTYISPEDGDMEAVFSNIINDVIIVKDGNGDVYWPQYGLNSIGDLTWGEGYQIKVISDVILDISGNIIPSTYPILIDQGWSILGYLHQDCFNAIDMMDPVVDALIIMKDESGNVFWPTFGLNSIGNMCSGRGYQIKMLNAVELSYPDLLNSRFNLQNKEYFSNRKPINTGNNMILGIPESCWAIKPEINDEIIIYDNSGIIVGLGMYKDEMNAITIWGDDHLTAEKDGLYNGEKFSIRLWKNREQKMYDLNIHNFKEGSNIYSVNGISIAQTITLSEIHSKELIKITDILGRDIDINNKEKILIYIYNDGSIEKKYFVE